MDFEMIDPSPQEGASPREMAEWESKRASYDVLAIHMEIRCAETLKDLHSMAYFRSPDPAVRFKIEGYVLGIQDEIARLRKKEAELVKMKDYWQERCRSLIIGGNGAKV